MREKFHLNGKSHRERNCLHEALKSLEIWDEHISVILRFLDAHKLSRTWSPSAQKLYSGACLVDQISLFDWQCKNRQDSTANLACQVVVM